MNFTDYTNHLNSAEDLVTSYEETRSGFISMALEKNREAMPYVAEAKVLKELASQLRSSLELMVNDELYPSLLTAAGISDKANTYLTDENRKEAVKSFIEQFLEPAGEDFVDELVFRFLLIRGDSLGGKMRNTAGRLAERKVTRALIANLSISGKAFSWLEKDTLAWILGDKNNPNIELHTRGLHWEKDGSDRVLIYNLTVPFVGNRGNNVDLCLFSTSPEQIILKGTKTKKSAHRIPDSYLALGELKGGIDPAGADEHWKTARSALGRIQSAFSEREISPSLFYLGAAIQSAMADEIYTQLEAKEICNAANLTVDSQLNSLCKWLVSI
ncbi:MAG: restriction endonuclease [Thermoproteota archaeon]|nr:MAG: restriction endonuclease [Candidatus Korarchaeota archaeon]